MKNNKGIAPILIVLIIVGILALGGGTYYFLAKRTQKPVSCTLEAKICPDGSAVGRTGPNCEFAQCPNVKKNEAVDCKSDLDCFIEESKNCNLSKVINTITTDIFGVKQITTSFFEIKRMESDKCIFYIRTDKIDLTFPPETAQEIVNQQKEIYQKLEGRDGNCKFKTSDLTAMLIRWKAGDLSSDDFKIAECSGKMFEASL
jgi:hypothetical protein